MDAGGFDADLRWAGDGADQFKFGIELRRRSYPQGPLRDRNRDMIEISGTWRGAFAEGRASINLTAGGGVLWGFAPHWEIGPNLLHVRDSSNVLGNNYSFTELNLMLRRDF